MIHKARHDNEKQVCETCKDFFVHYFLFDSAPGGSTERSEPQYREPARARDACRRELFKRLYIEAYTHKFMWCISGTLVG